MWSLAASASQTLLDGGGRSASVAATRATYDQSVATYRHTVLSAFKDVEDALSNLRILKQQAQAQAEAGSSPSGPLNLPQRIQGGYRGLHHRRDRPGDRAHQRGIGARDPAEPACRQRQFDQGPRWRLGCVPTATNGGTIRVALRCNVFFPRRIPVFCLDSRQGSRRLSSKPRMIG